MQAPQAQPGDNDFTAGLIPKAGGGSSSVGTGSGDEDFSAGLVSKAHQPEQPGIFRRALNYTLGTFGPDADKYQHQGLIENTSRKIGERVSEMEQEDVHKAATTGETPGIPRQLNEAAAGIVQSLVNGANNPANGVQGVAAMAFPVTRLPLGAYNAYQGIKTAFTPKQPGESNLEYAARIGGGVGQGIVGGALAKSGTGAIQRKLATPATAPQEALATFMGSSRGATEAHATAGEIRPLLLRQAATDGLNLSRLSGRSAGEAVQRTTTNAINSTQAQIDQISAPHNNTLQDQTPIADAYLKARTPELVKNDPGAAKRLLNEARKFADVNGQGQVIGVKPATLGEVNALRKRLNNETAAAQSKEAGAFRKTDWESKADVDAVAAARDVQYKGLAAQSGVQEPVIRQLFRNEGQLLEFRESFSKEFEGASRAHSEAVASSLRANPPGSGRFATTALQRVGNTYPSPRGAIHGTLKETAAPLPLEAFNNRLKLAFSGKAAPVAPTAPTTPPTAGGGGGQPAQGQPQTPQTPQAPQTPAPPAAVAPTSQTPVTTPTAAPASPPAPITPTTVQLGPGAPGLMGTTRSISVGGKTLGTINYSIRGDTLEINNAGGPLGNYQAMSNALGRSGMGQALDQIRADHPEVKYVQGIRVGGARGDAARSVRFPIEGLPKTIHPADAAYTTARAQLGANAPPDQVRALAKTLTPPSPPPSRPPAAPIAKPPRAVAGGHMTVTDVMERQKSGEITPQQADRLIQRIRGGGTGKTTQFQPPTAPATSPEGISHEGDVTFSVNGEPVTTRLSPEQQAQWKSEYQDYQNALNSANQWKDNPSQRQAQIKSAGMRWTAAKRQITGNLTAKEAAAEAARNKSNFMGKQVSWLGNPATVVGTSFGKIRLKLSNGRVVSALPEEIKGTE